MTLSKSKAVDFTILRFLACFGLAIVCALAAQTGFAGEQWSRFRGPNGTGLADTDQLPIKVGDSNKVWKVDLQGTGSSSPVFGIARFF